MTDEETGTDREMPGERDGGDATGESAGHDAAPGPAADPGGPGSGGENTWGLGIVGRDVDESEADAASEGGGEGVAGPFSPSGPVEPGTPAPENAAFVAAGVLLAVLVIASAVVSLDPVAVLGMSGIVAVAAGGLLEFFRRF